MYISTKEYGMDQRLHSLFPADLWYFYSQSFFASSSYISVIVKYESEIWPSKFQNKFKKEKKFLHCYVAADEFEEVSNTGWPPLRNETFFKIILNIC